MDRLVEENALRFSSQFLDPGRPGKTAVFGSSTDPGCSGVVVHRPASSFGVSTQEAAVQTGSPVPVQAQVHHPNLLSELGGLAPKVLQYRHLNLPQECMAILKEAKRPMR